MPITDPEARRRSAVAFVRQAKPRPVASGPRAPVQADGGEVVELAAVRLAREKVGLARDEAALAQQLGTLAPREELRGWARAGIVAVRRGLDRAKRRVAGMLPKGLRESVRAALQAEADETIEEAVSAWRLEGEPARARPGSGGGGV